MEPTFRELYQAREREVSPEEKQRLFLLAGDIIFVGEGETRPIVDAGNKVYIDSNKFPAKHHSLEINTAKDQKWAPLKALGIAQVEFNYWPERSLGDETFPDQINIGVIKTSNTSFDLFTMKVRIEEGSFRVSIVNRVEIDKLKVKLLEVSQGDAARISEILSSIQEILNPGLATP